MTEYKPMASQIISIVSDETGISVEALRGTSRQRMIVYARQMAFYAIREWLDWSMPRIGAYFDRDHTTILHGIRNAERLIGSDVAYAEAYVAVSNRIGSRMKLNESVRKLSPLRIKDIGTGAKQERERIIGWLISKSDNSHICHMIASAIERQEHYEDGTASLSQDTDGF